MQNCCEFDFKESNNLKITMYCSCSWSFRHNDISHVESLSKLPFSKILSGYHTYSRASVILFQLNTVLALLELRIKFGKVQTVQRATA